MRHGRRRGRAALLLLWALWSPAFVAPGPESHEALPLELEPLRYDVELALDPERSSSFKGHAKIALNVTRETDTIIFNARSLALSSVLLIQGETLEPEILTDKAWERAP